MDVPVSLVLDPALDVESVVSYDLDVLSVNVSDVEDIFCPSDVKISSCVGDFSD